MSRMQREKGANAERELIGAIYDELGVRLMRNLEQSRAGGHDLTLAPGETGPVAEALGRFAVEVKRHARADRSALRAWWAQAETQAETAGLVPVLAYRVDRAPWRIILPLVELREGLTRAPGLDFTAELSLLAFCALVREGRTEKPIRARSRSGNRMIRSPPTMTPTTDP